MIEKQSNYITKLKNEVQQIIKSLKEISSAELISNEQAVIDKEKLEAMKIIMGSQNTRITKRIVRKVGLIGRPMFAGCLI